MARAQTKSSSAASLWPWPGNLFLMLLAAWLIYMGTVAELEDVKTAFYGLAGVTGVVLLLGLRKAFDPSRRSASAGRSNIDDADDPFDPAIARAVPIQRMGDDGTEIDQTAGLPMNQRMRAERGVDAASLAATPSPIPPATPSPVVPEGKLSSKDMADAMRKLELRLHQQHQEKAAHISSVSTAVMEEISRLKEDAGPSLDEEKLAEHLESYLTVSAFNNAVNARIIPRVEEMVRSQIEAALNAEVMREALAPALGDAGQRLAAVEARQSDAVEATTRDFALLREEARLGRELAEKAVRMAAARAEGDGSTVDPGPITAMLDDLRTTQSADRQALQEVKTSLDGLTSRLSSEGGGVPAGLKQTIQALNSKVDDVRARLAETDRRIADVKDDQAATQQHVAKMGEHYQEMMRRLDLVGTSIAGSTAQEVKTDVEALRDALTTIIEQNHDIRAQQEVLSARFDAPTRVEIDPGKS
ncbi:MAG: hypothetical protein AAGD34_04170 [Pseudomonadota bacterium]